MADIPAVSNEPVQYTAWPPDPSLPPINVLVEVEVDSQGISLIGRYDPAYPTGGIPYAALLADAINSPHPGFDLEPFIPEQTKEAIAREMARLHGLNDTASRQYLGGLILAYPDLQDQVIAALPNEIGLETRRAMTLGFATCFSQGKTDCSGSLPIESLDPLLIPIVLEQAGLSQAAAAMRASLAYGGTITWSQVPSEFTAKLNGLSDDQVRRFILIKMSAGLGLPDPTASVDRAMASTEEMRALGALLKERTEHAFFPRFTQMVTGAFFNHLVLSSKDMKARYGDLGYVTLRFINLPSNSQLARILFEADYQTKFLDQLNTRSVVPNHKDWEEFPLAEGQSYGTVDMTLLPDTVQVAYNGSRAKFMEATLRLSCSASVDQGEADAYCNQVTQHFDEYAHALPSLHALSEAMKVVALAPWLRRQGITAGEEDHSWVSPARVAPEAGVHFYSPTNLPTGWVSASIEGGVDFTQVEPTIINGATMAFTDASLFEVALPRGTYAPLPQDPTLTVMRLGRKLDPKEERTSDNQALITGIEPPRKIPTGGPSPSLRTDPGFGTLSLQGIPLKIEVPEPEDVKDTIGPIEPGQPQWHVTVDKWAALGRFAADQDLADGGFPKAALGIGLINALRENTESFAWYPIVTGLVTGLQIQTNWFDSWLSQQAGSVTGQRPKHLVIPIGASLPGGKWNQAQLFISADHYRSAYLGIDSQGQLVLYPMWGEGDYILEYPGSTDLIPLKNFGHYGLPTGLPAAALLEGMP